MKCGIYVLRKGRKVVVFSAHNRRYLGIWEFDRAIQIGTFGIDRKKIYTPRFIQGKKKIHGYACWWIPLSDWERIENGVNHEAL